MRKNIIFLILSLFFIIHADAIAKVVTVKLLNSSESGISGAEIKYYQNGWKTAGTTNDNGIVQIDLPDGSYIFGVSYLGLWNQKNQNIADNADVIFHTKKVSINLQTETGDPLQDALAKFYGSGWRNIGNTNSWGEVSIELLPGNIIFGISYGGLWAQKTQNINDSAEIIFNTKKVTVKLLASDGTPLSGALTKYYGSGWKNIGNTNENGEATIEVLPNNIIFGVSYGGLWTQKSQDIRSDINVIFNTVGIDVLFTDSESNAIEGALVKYYGSGWKNIGTTNSEGKAHVELLPNNIPFGISYGGLWNQKNFDIRKTTDVSFATKKVTISLLNSSGEGLKDALVKYYGSGWKTIGQTNDDGKVETELLENSITFGVSFGGLWAQKKQNIGQDNNVIFQTKKVTVTLTDSKGNPLSGAETKYYGSGWKTIGNTDENGEAFLEALPNRFAFGIRYDGSWQQKTVDIRNTETVNFNTIETIVKLLGGGGSGIAGATAKYYASGWKTIGVTDENGEAIKEILPGRYTFYLSYQNESFRKNQDNRDNNIVSFYTTSEADLDLSASVDNDSPSDKEEITVTYTLHNNGPSNASGVKVQIPVPNGLMYVSSEATNGSYEKDKEVWSLNSLATSQSATLKLKLKADFSSLNSESIDLAEASDFNMFLFGDLNQPSSQTEGKLAAGGDVELSEYTVGASLNLPQPEDVLIVGGNLTYNSGSVHNGNVVYGLSTNLPQDLVGIPDGVFRQDDVIDFNAAQAHLKSLSDYLSNLRSNGGQVLYQYGKLTLDGENPLTNVFVVGADTMKNVNDYEISAPNGSTVIIIVDADSINLGGGFNVYGTSPNNVIFVFNQTKKLIIEGIALYGSILAPNADVNFISGSMYGQMIAKSLVGEGHLGNEPFVGYLPPETKINLTAEIFVADQQDPDSKPNNGDVNEDDYASVEVEIKENTNPNNGDSPDISWAQVAQFSSNEIVWDLTYDSNLLPLAGTWGGGIYRYEDNQWKLINEGMNVSYIWDLANQSGEFYAATERGIFYSTDNGLTWSEFALAGKDVRKLAFDSAENIIAAVWGEGVYKYNKSTSSWDNITNNLGNLSVQAVLVDDNDNILVGTFGGGIYRSTDGGESWNETNMEYKYIWTLEKDPENNNKIYAGAYGGGMYVSVSNGGTWSRKNSGLPSRYVYSITVGEDGKVFISTWSGGVYYSENSGNSWTNLGLIGFDASSVVVIPTPPTGSAGNALLSEGTLYIGTGDGTIYTTNAAITDVKGNDGTANKFELSQNYPNPFNPTTTINYSIPMLETHPDRSGASQQNGINITLKVYDILGREVATLINKKQAPGNYSMEFNASDLASGIYIYRLSYGNNIISKKMILLK